VNRGMEERASVQPSSRAVLCDYSAANVKAGAGTSDYGKASVQVYANERDVTTTRTHKGNVQSLIKALVAPIADVIKTSKKEFFTDAAREFGSLSAQIPSKITVRDPNNVARTTIKETNLHDTEQFNLKGPTRITVYDPADVARTTGRQTMLQESEMMNMSAHTFKGTTYDPNDVAPTTIKETLLQDTDPANLRSAETRSKAYIPDDTTKPTLKQTVLGLGDTNVNFSTQGIHKGLIVDPDGTMRTTIRETIPDDDHLGLVSGPANKAEYSAFEFDIKGTQQDSYVDNDYFGGGQIGQGGEGYKDANFEAKETMKQTTSIEYYGTAADQGTGAQTLHDDVYNTTFKNQRELVDRVPTTLGQKQVAAPQDFDIRKTVLEPQVEMRPMPQTKFTNKPRIGETRERQHLAEADDRLDMEILEPFKRNPFTQSLHSVA